jgi:hypothetical protein
MHINVYEEELGTQVPVEVKRRVKDGVAYYGVSLKLRGPENQLTIWSKDKDRLVNLFNGLVLYLEIGATGGLLVTETHDAAQCAPTQGYSHA